MGLNCWFRDDVKNILLAVLKARSPVTTDEAMIVMAIAAGFGIDVEELIDGITKKRGKSQREKADSCPTEVHTQI
jgi:hypothetical protein